ncbi:hypothetical protein HMPREF1531_00076 [Propionibacterium sp. oral taxon 192 str. F0372]|uniref:thiamine-binding protein n=1 Tax=Propionibacterium sp. oral taxon 192 TaxID=671222 RepID=UPI0003528809|nr:thiamine-binding protein [Propionibacterium sp. oral taxon 192]EPH07029.1 hypothetical protein HMPREF1531_00076 [Propionibacterium sp. oral taxon 192 str. F0372]
MLVAFSITPSDSGEDGSVHDAVAAAVKVVRESGLPNETNSMFTNIEGSWEECFSVIHQAVEAVAAVSPRVALVLKADIRGERSGEMTGKVERLEAALGTLRSE